MKYLLVVVMVMVTFVVRGSRYETAYTWGLGLFSAGLMFWLLVQGVRADRQARRDLARLAAWRARAEKEWAETGRLPRRGPW